MDCKAANFKSIKNPDDILSHFKHPGFFYILIFFSLGSNYIFVAFRTLSIIFYGKYFPHHCKVSDLNFSIPKSKDGRFEQCLMYSNRTLDNTTRSCKDGWQYENNWTIISEWDLVCSRQYLVAVSASVYFFGCMIGGCLFGNLSDRFGRRPFLLCTLYGLLAIALAMYFAQSIVQYIILKLFEGIFAQGVQGITSVMIAELLPPELRTLGAIVTGIIWCIGILILVLIAYIFTYWRKIQLAIFSISTISIFYYWLIPESLHWLICNQKKEEAKKVLTRLLAFQKIKMDVNILDYVNINKNENKNIKYGILDLFRTPVIRRCTLVFCFMWFSTSWTYFGLSLGVLNQEGSTHLNTTISALVEILANMVIYFIIIKKGKKIPMVIFYMLAGISCIASGILGEFKVLNHELLRPGLALFGRGCLGASYTVIFFCTAQYFPTLIRNIALGLCLLCDSIGTTLAPQMAHLGRVTYPFIPVVIFGSLSFLAGLFFSTLPDTSNQQLPETIEDLEQMGKHISKRPPSYTYENYCFHSDGIYSSGDVISMNNLDMDTRL